MTWFWLALAAAASMGVSYAVFGHLVKFVPGHVVMLVGSVGSLLIYGVMTALGKEWGQVSKLLSPPLVGWMMLQIAALVALNLLSAWAIQRQNATMVSVVEMSYPIFVALAAFVLFREVQFTMGVAVGGALILAGVVCVYLWK
ncbi:MAG: hypothetical protein EBR79_03715 [Proteobacteria bacterium]|nr:hypothetical protein [Pseudomonadota bacterium]NBX86189.1 hypothetical protein [Pseudomonadota bacterium]